MGREMNLVETAAHYDWLIDHDNDPFRDPPSLKEYMDKWDGSLFIDSMQLTPAKKVLEIGVGTGRLAAKAAPFCFKLSGIDISPKTIRRARENLSGFQNVELICAGFLEHPFAETFDVIYSSLTLMHFADKGRFICKAGELLNENGVFCLSIDKSLNDTIDTGDHQLRIYPDKADEIREYIQLSSMYLSSQFETDFAHIFVCSK